MGMIVSVKSGVVIILFANKINTCASAAASVVDVTSTCFGEEVFWVRSPIVVFSGWSCVRERKGKLRSV